MKKTNFITKQAMIAAIYAVVSLALAPISFGTVQARVSEALTMLPVFGTTNIIGISVGCLITNIVGVFSGTKYLGLDGCYIRHPCYPFRRISDIYIQKHKI